MKYKISFITGNLKGAGTDANVSIKIFGTKKITNELVLVSKFKNFERDVTDIFFIETSDLGEIEKIKISHDNQFLGANWYLDEVIIESRSKNKSWYFPVFKWIRKDHKVFVKSTKSAVYHFEISTGTLPGSGTKDTIHISLVGEKTYTPFIGINKYLPDKELKTGNSVKFSTMLEDVGKITSVHVKSYGDSFDRKTLEGLLDILEKFAPDLIGIEQLAPVQIHAMLAREDEFKGLDISQHGMETYAGFQIFTNE